MTPQIKPLSYRHRNFFFYALASAFFLSLPFLFLYATGYRFNPFDNQFVSTGGLYVAAERTGAQIYIDDELVRETRVFRRAFYAQGLEATTHKVHVQKEGHHTWVKELPVYPHLVTEAQSFNLPIIPTVKVITPWRTGSGVAVLTSSSTILASSESSNQYLFEPRASTSTLEVDPEFASLIELFKSATTSKATTTLEVATSTKEWRGVRLFEGLNKDVFASFVGPYEQMPYYYCAETFPPYDASTSTSNTLTASAAMSEVVNPDQEDELVLPVQSVSPNKICEPVIKIDRANEEVSYFDFFPNSTDLVVLSQESGIYVVEIDDRAWQNRQPMLLAKDLKTIVYNGAVYAYDGNYIYQIIITQNWF